MADVDVSVADYLKAEALFAAAENPSAVAWGERGLESETISPLYNRADAELEAARQAGFLAGPLVEDVVTVDGARKDLMLKPILVTGTQLGYGDPVPAFVIGYAELPTNVTELTVVRSLAA